MTRGVITAATAAGPPAHPGHGHLVILVAVEDLDGYRQGDEVTIATGHEVIVDPARVEVVQVEPGQRLVYVMVPEDLLPGAGSPELAAMTLIVQALGRLGRAEQARVVEWAASRFGPRLPGPGEG